MFIIIRLIIYAESLSCVYRVEAIDTIIIVSDIYRDLITTASTMARMTGSPVTLQETTDTELGTEITNEEDAAQGAIDLAGQPTTPGKIDVLGKTYSNLEEDVCYVNQE